LRRGKIIGVKRFRRWLFAGLALLSLMACITSLILMKVDTDFDLPRIGPIKQLEISSYHGYLGFVYRWDANETKDSGFFLVSIVKGAALFTAFWIILLLRSINWRTRQSGRCKNCGYDLRATPDRCPECGKVVEKTI
jgi:hypothetical protein